jgi:hypothetical protein
MTLFSQRKSTQGAAACTACLSGSSTVGLSARIAQTDCKCNAGFEGADGTQWFAFEWRCFRAGVISYLFLFLRLMMFGLQHRLCGGPLEEHNGVRFVRW